MKIIKYLLVSFFCLTLNSASFALDVPNEVFYYCGPGYILTTNTQTDGIDTYECKKLWCRDFENGKTMGNNNLPYSGYKTTSVPMELCDAEGDCVECFGDRKWCSGESAGVWNPEYGAYTRGGGDTATYGSYQKGSCFTWRLEKPSCADGEMSILKNGEWVCVTSVDGSQVSTSHGSSIRRTGSYRFMAK